MVMDRRDAMTATTRSRRERLRGWTAIVVSTGSRISFSLLYTVFVAASLSDNQASRVYQLLFLQGGLIALLAASAYARGAHVAARRTATGTTRSFVRYLTVGALGAFAVAVGFVPLEDATTQVRLGVFAFMVLGAAGSALNGLLQGLTVTTVGAAAAFLPMLVLNLFACLVTLGLWGHQPMLMVTAVWAFPQIAAPVALIALRSELRPSFRVTDATAETDSNHFAATGIVNAASIPIAYVFRERWAAAQNSSEAAVGFGVVRFTEIGYQILYMLLASTPHLVNRFVIRLSSGAHRFRVVLVMVPLAALGAISAVIESSFSTARFLIAECLVAPGRILCVFCLLYLLGRPSTRAYQMAVSVSVLISASLMLVPWLQESPYALQVLQAAGFIPTAVVTASTTGQGGRRGGTDGPHVRRGSDVP
jgi:hypothetical protein